MISLQLFLPGPRPGTRTTGGAIAACAARMLCATVSNDMLECSMSRHTKSIPLSASTSVTSGEPMQFHDPMSVRDDCSARKMRWYRLSHLPSAPAALPCHLVSLTHRPVLLAALAVLAAFKGTRKDRTYDGPSTARAQARPVRALNNCLCRCAMRSTHHRSRHRRVREKAEELETGDLDSLKSRACARGWWPSSDPGAALIGQIEDMQRD